MSVESADAIFARANAAHVEENYAGAAALYDEALECEPTKVEYLMARAQNSLKLRQFSSAAADALKAASAQPQNANAHFRHATALFQLDRFADAKGAFERAAALGKTESDLWIRKCQAELNAAASSSSSPASSGAFTAPATAAPTAAAAPAATAAAPAAPAAPKTLAEQIRARPDGGHAWIQSATQISLTIFAKNTPADRVHVAFEERRCAVRIRCSDESEFERTFELARAIDPAGSTFKVTAYKIEISLKKVTAADQRPEWPALEVGDAKAASGAQTVHVPAPAADKPLAYPTSSKKKVDYSEVEKAVTKEEEEEKPQGDAALNKLFQQIYKNGSEETRRAMMKSFQTSGGTVLSTNWGEVKEKDYEKDIQAPAGQVAKKWSDLHS